VGLAALLWGGPLLGQRYAVSTLDTGAPVTEVSLVDMGGDRAADLVVTVAETTPEGVRRSVLVYVQSKGAFAARPTWRRTLDGDVTAILFADIEGDAACELLALDDRGLLAWRRQPDGQPAEAPERLVEVVNRFYRPADETVEHVERSRDIDGDGRDDLVLPTLEGYRIYWGRQGGALAEGPLFKAAQQTEYGWGWGNTWFTMIDRLPAFVLADVSGDGRPDAVLRDDERLTFFEQGAGGTFPAEGRRIELALPQAGADPKDAGDVVRSSTLLHADVDGDRRMDIVAASTEGQLSLFSSFTISVALYRNTAKGLPKEPGQVIRLKGATLGVQLADLSGDGRVDLVVPVIDTDLFANLVDRLKGKMKVTYNVFFFEKNRFSRNPTFTHTTWIPYDVVEGRTGIPQADFKGDFNGDGRIDMLYADRPDRLAMFVTERDDPWFGGPKFSIAGEPMAALAVGEPAATRAGDLNGDGRSDLVVRYRSASDKASHVVIMMSQ